MNASTPAPASLGVVSPERIADVRTAVAALGRLLIEVQDKVNSGIDIDLAGLAETTAALCAEVEALPADDARTMVPDLSALVEGCERIASSVAVRIAAEAQPGV